MRTYSDIVVDTFWSPIKSILAVDDEFPTLDILLEWTKRAADLAGGARDRNPTEPDIAEPEDRLTSRMQAECVRLSEFSLYCKDQAWLFDIHDGRAATGAQAAIFKRPDLLVLDYRLDGEGGDTSRSIGIVGELACSEDFNLVVIYTKDEPKDVLPALFVALSNRAGAFEVPAEIAQQLDELLDVAEDRDVEIRSKLDKAIGILPCYVFLREGIDSTSELAQGVKAQLWAMFEEAGLDRGQFENLLKWKLSEFCKTFPEPTKPVAVNASQLDSATPWVVAGNVFVTIVNKAANPTSMFDQLKCALVDWHPSPNRLALAAFRTEIRKVGVEPSSEMLTNVDLQAFWLESLLAETSDNELPFHVGVLVDRQIELVSDVVRPSVLEFTQDLMLKVRSEGNLARQLDNFFGLKNGFSKQRGILAHNIHVSSKRRSGKNLAPGHILKIDLEPAEFWVCLTAACDLEAGRGGRDIKDRLRSVMPFTAVKLQTVDEKVALKNASRGWFVFTNGLTHSIYKSGDSKNNPVWEEFFAADEGRIRKENGFRVGLLRIDQAEEGTVPVFKQFQGEIVAQLRNDYAHSLAARLNAHLGRIGTDFANSR